MVLEIRDKVFDTLRIKNLLRQGENNVDTVSFVIKRYYNDLDLSTLSYVLYGDSQSNTRASIELEKEVLEDKLTLIWKIQKDFTAVAGTLTLLIKGYNTQKQEVIKFTGYSPIEVKKTDPNGATVVPPESEYDQALEKLYQILEEAKEVSMYPPRIGENDNWEVYNNVLNEYVDTGISVRGAQPKGEWSASATYQKLDIVSYQGSSFAVLKEITGIVPTNDNINYMLIAQKGDIGKSAYEYAKESGFVGTEQDFAQAQSDILNAKNEVESVKEEVSLIQTQVNQSATQVSNDKQAVETARQDVSLKHTEVLEKAEQVKTSVESFDSSIAQAKEEIETSKTNAVQEINRSGETAKQSVVAEGTKQTESVTNAGAQSVANVQSKATEQLNLIAAAGSTEVQKVATEGAKQVQAATEQANLAKQSADSAASKVQEVTESVTAGKQEIATAKDSALSAVQGEGGKQVQAVNTAGTAQMQAVNDVGKAQISAVQSEGTKQSKAVADAGAAQVQAVGAEGQKQVAAVQAEGQKQAEQIKAIESLLPAPTAQDAGKVPMVNPEGNGYELGEVNSGGSVDAYTKSEADAIFARKDELDLKVLETYYNLRRTGKVYQAKVWKFAANRTSACEKLADNAGLVCEASTNTTERRDDYANIPLFDWRYCNYIREDDGSPIPTAIEGMESYKESGAVDVGAMHMSFWWGIKDCGNYEIYTISDSPHPELGLSPWVECVREDGTVLPWCIGSAFISSKGEDGLLHSLPNRKPERHQSYNNMMTNYGKKGKGYHGAGGSNMVYQQLMMVIKYGTKSSQSVFGGCTIYSVQLPASIERAEADTYFPIKKTDKIEFYVGNRVSIGYGADNNGAVNLDRGVATIHQYADSAEILAVEDIDEQNAKLVLDAPPFNTLPVSVGTITSPIYVTSMPWYTGSTKSVLGRHDGGNNPPSAYIYPYRINGREYAIGTYEIASDTVMIFQPDYSKDVYLAPKGAKRTSIETEIKRDYIKLGNIPAASNATDFWIGDIKIAPEGSWYPLVIGTGERVGTGDRCYSGGKYTTGTGEYLQGGDLGSGSHAGSACLFCGAGLGSAGWNCAARD